MQATVRSAPPLLVSHASYLNPGRVARPRHRARLQRVTAALPGQVRPRLTDVVPIVILRLEHVVQVPALLLEEIQPVIGSTDGRMEVILCPRLRVLLALRLLGAAARFLLLSVLAAL